MTAAVAALAPARLITKAACAALGLSRASVQRRRAQHLRPPVPLRPRNPPQRALTLPQQQTVLGVLHESRFADQAPAEICACLLDEGIYHCSIRTMYRILAANAEVRERRAQLRHPDYKKPESQFPKSFGCIEDANTFCRGFFDWYNQDHHYAGIGLMTPNQVHYGQADQVYAARQVTLNIAFRQNPERFVNSAPKPPSKPTAAWINPPLAGRPLSKLQLQA